ncbi:MAG TPA: ubiquinone/menaquinone biosynthesis methyltransferase [Phycisphaerae bacterium]|nr:ubiquinone/menaquinone biosynthesis methyltransferase [Phycisphaerae bacterium]HNU45745.1 ubiquinone/menaquinone biosynthesis methyltransferase [Phycisphaerae bacterium]
MTLPQPPIWDAERLADPHTAPDKAQRVRAMFNAIAGRYELVNLLFSLGIDAGWRRRAVGVAGITAADEVLDVACGTGDFARCFARAGAARVVGCDFAHGMLLRARGRPRAKLDWCEADALRLPFADGAFSVTSCAFGVRNFTDLASGLREMGRVLRSGGRAVILEFTRPRHVLVRRVYELYATRLMPAAAGLVSGDRTGAYRYLPRSVVCFLSAEQTVAALREAGFAQVRAVPLTLGIVTVYVAVRE